MKKKICTQGIELSTQLGVGLGTKRNWIEGSQKLMSTLRDWIENSQGLNQILSENKLSNSKD